MNALVLLLASSVIELPLAAGPPDPALPAQLSGVPGVERVEIGSRTLRLELAPGAELRLSELETAAGESKIDRGRLPVGPMTVFEIDAGQCFFCAEGPLSKRLSQKSAVQRFWIVDYLAHGRLRFRIEPRSPSATLADLGRLPVEDIVFTDRYQGIERVDLYWPTGGILWRESEPTARREATRSRKPLMIFPTAGT